MITKVKGTQDFINLDLYNFTLNEIRKHLAHHNFNEIITPILEPTELYKRSLGLQTDVVKKEMYTLGDEADLCLRPEGTASIVRAFAENGVQQTPWKVFEHSPCFRHERPQKGRFRQFTQISVEAIGAASMAQDAFFIKMLNSLFANVFKLDTFTLHLNFLGTRQDREQHKKALLEFLNQHASSLCQTCLERKDTNTMRVFDCKNEACQALYKNAPKITQHLSEQSQAEWNELRQMLDLLSVTYIEAPGLVRGLDYYNKTVFEFMSTDLGAQNTFCGGGRYDHLVGEIGGGQDQPAVGAGIGLERLVLILETKRNQLAIPQAPQLIVVIPFEQAQQPLALLIANELITHNKYVDIIVDEPSVKSKMRKANKLGAQWAVIVGPDEQKNKTAVLKNMITGDQKTIAQTAIIKELS